MSRIFSYIQYVLTILAMSLAFAVYAEGEETETPIEDTNVNINSSWTITTIKNTTFVPAQYNLLRGMDGIGTGMMVETSAGMTKSVLHVTDGVFGEARKQYLGMYGEGGSLEFQFDSAKLINEIRIYSAWEGGTRVGIYVKDIQIQKEKGGEFVSAGLPAKSTANNVWTGFLKTDDGSTMINKTYGIKIVFDKFPTYSYFGLAEVEAIGWGAEANTVNIFDSNGPFGENPIVQNITAGENSISINEFAYVADNVRYKAVGATMVMRKANNTVVTNKFDSTTCNFNLEEGDFADLYCNWDTTPEYLVTVNAKDGIVPVANQVWVRKGDVVELSVKEGGEKWTWLSEKIPAANSHDRTVSFEVNEPVVVELGKIFKPELYDVEVVNEDGYSKIKFAAKLLSIGTDDNGDAETSAKIYLSLGTDEATYLDNEEIIFDNLTEVGINNEIVKDLISARKYYYRFRVENSAGIYGDKEWKGTIFTYLQGNHLPAKVKYSKRTDVKYSTGNDIRYLCDYGTSLTPKKDTKDPFIFDVGEPRLVEQINMYFPTDAFILEEAIDGFEVWASNKRDGGEDEWVKVFEKSSFDKIATAVWLRGLTAAKSKYRYYEFRNVALRMSEIALMSRDLGVHLKPIKNWSSKAPDAADASEGATITGVYRGNEDGAKLYGYWAMQDYEDNESLWKLHGTRFEIADNVAINAAFTKMVKANKSGVVYVRVYAKIGDKVNSCQRTHSFVNKGEVFVADLYICGTSEHSNGWYAYNVYDNNTSTACDIAKTFIFDLRKIPARRVLSGLKLWHRNETAQVRDRGYSAKIDLGFEKDVDISSRVLKSAPVEGRNVAYIDGSSTVAGLTWKTFAINEDGSELLDTNMATFTFKFDKPKEQATFMRVSGISNGNLQEIVFLTSPVPPKGFKIIVR